MTWTTKKKDLAITQLVARPSAAAGVIGRVPGISTINITPFELFGAAARCSHLHLVNPAIVTPESLMIARLIEPHVDDHSNDFAVLGTTNRFKDFVKSYFVGTVAAGLAYLAMTQDGYIWADHFENLGGGNTSHTKKPDFAFSGVGTGIALMESKGSRSDSLGGLDATVADGYTHQVEPHLGHQVGGVTASHGYCIGAWLQSTTKAELRIHHTAAPVAPLAPRSDEDLSNIQRQDFATAFALAYGPSLGAALRAGRSHVADIPFLRFQWLEREWVTGLDLDLLSRSYWPLGLWPESFSDDQWALFVTGRLFAVELSRAEIALERFLGAVDRHIRSPELTPVDVDLREAARRGEEGTLGAVFPDGLALIDLTSIQSKIEPVLWNVRQRQFDPV